MAIFTNSKDTLGAITPTGAVESVWSRLEPLLTAGQLRSVHLFGIPLVSFIKNPLTGKPDIMNDEALNDHIVQAVSLAEVETGMQIFPTQHQEKHPFDAFLFKSLGYFMLRNRPVVSIQALSVVPANGVSIYSVPLDWIETAHMARGQINIIPINVAVVGSISSGTTSTAGGAYFLSILGGQRWIPAFWQITYTTGWVDGLIPRVVNQLIGTIAAIEILSLLATTYARNTSHSIGIDSMSQSVSTPGPQLFKVRIEELLLKKAMLVRKMKAMAGLLIVSGEV